MGAAVDTFVATETIHLNINYIYLTGTGPVEHGGSLEWGQL